MLTRRGVSNDTERLVPGFAGSLVVPALCGAESREYKYLGSGKYQAITGWLKPVGR